MHLCLLIYMMIGMHAYTQTLTSCKYSNTYIFFIEDHQWNGDACMYVHYK